MFGNQTISCRRWGFFCNSRRLEWLFNCQLFYALALKLWIILLFFVSHPFLYTIHALFMFSSLKHLSVCVFDSLQGVRMCIWGRLEAKQQKGMGWGLGGFRHSREWGNFTAGLLLRQSGWKCCRFVEQIEMVSVREQSAELNDEVGVCVCVEESEVGLWGSKFNNNPVTFKPHLSDTCQSICMQRLARPQSAVHCSSGSFSVCVRVSCVERKRWRVVLVPTELVQPWQP